MLAGDGSTVLSSGNLTFSAVYSDSELTDKYATGIDQGGIRVLLDGTDYTDQLEINEGSLYLKGVNLRNGSHTLTIRLKDFYGNVTEETRSFRVENEEGDALGHRCPAPAGDPGNWQGVRPFHREQYRRECDLGGGNGGLQYHGRCGEIS